jgi:RNA polymerase sigma-70 factor (ECF subfamily)
VGAASMNKGSAEDLALARQVAGGDEAALATFYARHADLLFAFISHHLGGPCAGAPRADVEDLWQDTLLAALHALPSYRGECRLSTWLCAIARHKVADHFRRQGRERIELFSDLSTSQLSALVSRGPLPEEMVLQRATRVRVVEALALLPDEYRSALIARYADGCSVGEVASALGRTYKAAESLLSRARAAFRADAAGAAGVHAGPVPPRRLSRLGRGPVGGGMGGRGSLVGRQSRRGGSVPVGESRAATDGCTASP